MKPYNRIEKTTISDLPISNVNYDQAIERIVEWGKQRQHRYIAICNVHSVTAASWTPGLKDALERSDMNTADGIPLVWMQRLLGYGKASRVYGPTLMLKALRRLEGENLRVALYGGHPERLPKLVENLKSWFPKLQIVETISPPFRRPTLLEKAEYTRRLKAAQPHVIWVGIGCPKQEMWMRENSPAIPGVMVGVGAAFDFHAGSVRQAPPRLQRLGLEWAFRLYCEPRRLFRRYLSTNPVFVLRSLAQLARRHLLRQSYLS